MTMSQCRDTDDVDPLAQRHELVQRVRNCRYLHRLVRAHFDIAVARATMTDDLRFVTELSRDPSAPDHESVRTVVATDGTTSLSLLELSRLLQQFASYERGLVEDLDRLTQQVVEQLKDCPAACLT